MKLSLRVKLILLIGSIILITLTSSSANNTTTAQKVITDAQRKHLEYITLTVGGLVKAEIARAQTDIAFAVTMPSIQKGLFLPEGTTMTPEKKWLCSLLAELASLSSNYETFYITTDKGLTLASNVVESVGVLDISNRPWFYSSLMSDDIHISAPFVSRFTGNNLIAISKRFEYQGKMGIMVGSLDLPRIIDPLLKSQQAPELNIFVVSTQGKVIASPDPTLYGTPVADNIFSILHGPPSKTQIVDINGNNKLLAYYRIPETSLFVVTLAEERYIAEPVTYVSTQARTTLILALLLASIAIGFIIFPLTRDIKKLSAYAEAIAQGKEQITTGVRRNDELGNLERSLSQMVHTLQDMIIQSKAATQAKSDFLARMSHEIRTPMNSILGMTYLALQSSPEPKQEQFLQKIDSATKNLLGLINDILDFSKMEAGKMSITPYTFSLSGMLLSTVELFQLTCKEKGIELITTTNEDVPDVIVGDSLRISQLCINLISNALKFTDQGSITIHIQLAQRKGDTLTLHFSIIDTGIGMTEEEQKKIFDSFTQVDGSATRRFGGTGLGLSICKLLTELMHGDIWVESTLHQGSTFHFTIQVQEGSQQELERTILSNETVDTSPLRPMHVLLVDDNEINREIATEMLKGLNITATSATNGNEAVQRCLTEDFDMILMDIQMPVMDGLTATRHIRENTTKETLATIPIIAMTANAMTGDRERSIAAGMNDYITKPIDINELQSILRLWQKTISPQES